jgi:hypothetical protein
MVASFGRSTLRLDPFNVSHLLQSCLGGIAEDFNVVHLRDRSYRFSVNSQQVGFFVHNLRHFKSSEFVVYFSLWGKGGPNFIREFRQWEFEEQQSWSVVKPKSTDSLKEHPLSGANTVPLGPANRSAMKPSQASQSVPKHYSFLSRLTDWEKDDLESAISAGYDYAQILNCFRFDHKDQPVYSPLDDFSPKELQDLRSLIAQKLTDIQLATIFRRDLSTAAPQSSVPASSVFNRVYAALATPSGNPSAPVLNTSSEEQFSLQHQPVARVSAFDRLQLPTQQPVELPAERVSAFQRLQAPIAPPPTSGPNWRPPVAARVEQNPRQSTQQGPKQPHLGPACPRCLSFGHLRRDCWKKIKCHSCNKEGHVKVDCHFYPDSGLKTRWVRKEAQAVYFGSNGLQSQGGNADRPINGSRVQMEEPLLDLTMSLSLLPNKRSSPLAASAPLSPQKQDQAVAPSSPSKSPHQTLARTVAPRRYRLHW